MNVAKNNDYSVPTRYDHQFGRPGKGNDKGKVEGLGYFRRNFMTPLPVAESFEMLNARFLDACTKRRQAILRGHTTTIAERVKADVPAVTGMEPELAMSPR
jgi:hypothetical protein